MSLRPQTLGACYRDMRDAFREAGIPNGDFEARLLTAHATGLEEHRLITEGEKLLDEGTIDRALSFKERRMAHEPVARIIGEWQFWGLSFELTHETLVPRADTETLVEALLNWCALNEKRDLPLQIIDIGTGSGAILIALLTELPNATGIANDISEAALETTLRNAKRHGAADRLKTHLGAYGDGCTGSFDIVVSNPPYIGREEISDLSKEVLEYDPELALFESEGGFAAYPQIASFAAARLKQDAILAVEHGYKQQEAVADCFTNYGFKKIEKIRDLNKQPRVVTAQRLHQD